MDKLQWLEEIARKSGNDPQAWYWLGVEHLQRGNAVQAIAAFGEGLKHGDGPIKQQLLDGLSDAASRLQHNQDVTIAQVANAEPDAARPEPAANPESPSPAPGSTSAPVPITAYAESGNRSAAPGLTVIDGGRSAPAEPPAKKEVTFEDVAGLDDLKKTIRLKIISPFFNQGLFSKFRKKAGGGVLLYGPPGCGKTFIARATAGECRAKFINVQITDILDPYIGVSEQNLKHMFETARAQKPSVMFFDEIDAIGFNRSKSSSHMRGLVDTLLSEMEGLESDTDQVLIMAATNMPWDVDAALKRPGRFDRIVFVAPPDAKAREQLFRLKLAGRPIDNIDYGQLARNTPYFSGADIEHACELAAERVLEEIMSSGVERLIRTEDLLEAVRQLQPSTLEWLRTVKNYVTYANQSGLYDEVEKFLKANPKF